MAVPTTDAWALLTIFTRPALKVRKAAAETALRSRGLGHLAGGRGPLRGRSPLGLTGAMTTTPKIEPQLGIPEAIVAWEPSEHPVITCYVDWRVSGRGLHEAQTVVRKELHTLQGQLPPRGEARESSEMVERYASRVTTSTFRLSTLR